MLRSIPKVEIEAGLCLIGFNLKQKSTLELKKNQKKGCHNH